MTNPKISRAAWEAANPIPAAPPAPPAPAGPPPPLTAEAIRAMSPAQQRKLATDRWPEVEAALSGNRPPGQKLTPAELANLGATVKAHPELVADPDRWNEIQAEMTRRAGAKR